MSLESKVHDALMNFPALKKATKRVYQVASVAISRSKKSEGNIKRVTPKDDYEYLFGYYDKSPWDASGRYMLCIRVKNASKAVAPKDEAEIVLIDTENNNKIEVLSKTHTWNVQQGCMLGWLGPDYDKEIIYNDFRKGKYVSIIRNVFTGDEKLFDAPVYTVSNDGKIALSLDFSRLHRLRPGYGYSNLEDKTKGEKVPDMPCVLKIDLKSGKVEPILSYKQLYDFEHRDDMDGAEHKVNHLMLSPDGKRFMVIHRWLKGGKKISRLLTCDIDGKDLYNLSDDNMVSHCYWKNNSEILAYCRKDGKNGYFLMKDKTPKYEQKWEWLTADGHPSYSPDGNFIVTDTYPNRKRICTLRVLSDTVSTIVAKVYAPFRYDNDVRCDLHPRWSRDGKKVCFDGCFEGKRGLYIVDVRRIAVDSKMGQKVKKSGKYKVLFVLNSCKDRGPTRVVYNIIKNLDYAKFNPVLLTLSEENEESNISEILPYVSSYVCCKTSKKEILSGKMNGLKMALKDIGPAVIHTTGVFPDYAISKISRQNQVVTLHNYAPFDYVAKFGRVKGELLVKMQYYAAKHAAKTVACSKSLSELYKKEGFDFDYIRNGIDIEKYKVYKDKSGLRERLGLKKDAFIFIYTGSFVSGKNIEYVLKGFARTYGDKSDKLFVLLGDGPELDRLRDEYACYDNIIFKGRVLNVDEYLSASDVYISASKSEGLPNGVLEAIASGLPVILSNIPQHREILEAGEKCGYAFALNDDEKQFVWAMKKTVDASELDAMPLVARKVAEKYFSASMMSKKYEERYDIIARKRRMTLFIGGLSGGGAERVTCNLANYLDESGHIVDVITLSDKKGTYRLNDDIRRVCLMKEDERTNPMHNLCLRQRRLRQYVLNNRDVVCYVAMLPLVVFMMTQLKKRVDGKIIISERNNPTSHSLTEKIMMKSAARRCDGLVVQTEEISEWYKGIKEKIVIPNAINKDIVIPRRKKIEKKIVAVGRLEKQKNYPMLIKAFSILSTLYPEYVLEIYGQGRQKEKIEKSIKKYRIEDRVRLMGYVDNVSELISNASCFVMTSNYEGIPNALIEAMCIGLPCIATDCDGGGAKSLIKDGKNGFLIGKNDVSNLVKLMRLIISDAKRANELGENAKRIKDTIGYEVIYGKWDDYIMKIVGNGER